MTVPAGYLAQRFFATKSNMEAGDKITGLNSANRSVNFPATPLVTAITQAGNAILKTAQSLSAAEKLIARTNIEALSSFSAGRTLTVSGATLAADYSTMVTLGGYTLNLPGVSDWRAGAAVMVLGPGTVDTTAASYKLQADEIAVLQCVDENTTVLLALTHFPGRLWFTDGDPPADAVARDQWYDESEGTFYVYDGNTFIEIVGGTNSGFTTVFNINGSAGALLAAHSGAYVRKAHSAAHTLSIPAEDGGDHNFQEQMVATIRNNSAYTLSVNPAFGVTVNAAPGRLSLGPYETLSLFYVGSNIWDAI